MAEFGYVLVWKYLANIQQLNAIYTAKVITIHSLRLSFIWGDRGRETFVGETWVGETGVISTQLNSAFSRFWLSLSWQSTSCTIRLNSNFEISGNN